MEEQKPQESKSNKNSAVLGYMLFEVGLEFAVMIALPLIGGILGGKWLDHKSNHHFYVIVGILLALSLSSAMIYKKIVDLQKMMKENK